MPPGTLITILFIRRISQKNYRSIISSTKNHIEILKGYFGDKILADDLPVNYPLLARGNLEQKLKFRDDYWHHLHAFRKAVEEGIKSKENVIDYLENDEAKIRHIIQKHKSKNIRSLASNLSITSLSAVATLATSGISSAFAAVIGALGGGHFSSKLIPDIIERYNDPSEAKSSQIYFAWKIKQQKH